MGRIYALVGRSGTGKSTLEKKLEELGYERIISNTTRKRRNNEQEDIDYHFLTEDEFNQLDMNNELLENTSYNNWRYGIAKKDIPNLDKQDYICVIEPNGLKQLQVNLKDRVIPIWIYSTPYERLLRSLLRQPNADDKTYLELCRRFTSDFNTFDDFENKKLYKYKVHNGDLNQAVNTIHSIIKYEQKQELLKIKIPIPCKVRITNINNKDKEEKLSKYINKEGHIMNFPIIKDDIARYKVFFLDDKENIIDKEMFRIGEFEVIK